MAIIYEERISIAHIDDIFVKISWKGFNSDKKVFGKLTVFLPSNDYDIFLNKNLCFENLVFLEELLNSSWGDVVNSSIFSKENTTYRKKSIKLAPSFSIRNLYEQGCEKVAKGLMPVCKKISEDKRVRDQVIEQKEFVPVCKKISEDKRISVRDQIIEQWEIDKRQIKENFIGSLIGSFIAKEKVHD